MFEISNSSSPIFEVPILFIIELVKLSFSIEKIPGKCLKNLWIDILSRKYID